jgi:light-regulated signal transduction histidine kinase (bacteriophytochrome)
MIENITERKQAEERLTRMTQDLTRSNADLERFASVASHDLREPLRMVGSFVQLLAERYRGQLDADADDYIGFAVDGVQRMERLINDLLEYSRLNTRGEPFRPIDAEAVLAQTLWDLDLTIAEADAVVTHDPLPAVLADPVQLAQLFQNLISNALKFHGAEPPRVHVSHSPAPSSAPCWLFSVRDNGIGIDPKDHTRIFDIFQRLHTREEYPGTGIGLAVCQRIVERHGGRIWVESQVGQGTTFFFTLPTP